MGARCSFEDGTMQEVQPARRTRSSARILYVGLATLGLVGPVIAQQVVPATPTGTPTVVTPLTLAACRQIALENQPAVAAARASQAAAVARAEAVQNLHVPTLLARDLPIRRKQSSLGLAVAQGAVLQAEGDTVYAVTYSYLAALYAAQARKLGGEVKRRLEDLRVLTQDALKGEERKDVIPEQLKQIEAFLKALEGRGVEATQGRARALAALREAMGVGCDFEILLPDRDLPCPQIQLTKEQVVALALERRGELVQAQTAERIVALEIDAQQALCMPSARTFAAGSDLHFQPLPAGLYGDEYRPGAITIEMPPSMAGSKASRVEQARIYHQRAEAVAAKARSLVTLEAEVAFLRWQEKSSQARIARAAYLGAQKFADALRPKFDPSGKRAYPSLADLQTAGLVATSLQVEELQDRFRSLIALAALERVTAGGISVDFDAPCAP
jgi:outer membrane protein TolC